MRAFLARERRTTLIGPYAIVTVELEGDRHETSVTWGEGGAEVGRFATEDCVGRQRAAAAHEELCARIEAELGVSRRPWLRPPAA